MVKYQKNFKIIKIIIYQFFLLKLVFSEDNECSREAPIKKRTQCLSQSCTQEQFDLGECIISNSIVKTQWLNNIIIIGDRDFRYINFMTTSKGEIIIYNVAYPSKNYRIFFGMNSKGDPIFKDLNNNNNYIIKKNVSNLIRYESDISLLKVTGDTDQNKEYLVSFGKSKVVTEIFDFQDYGKDLIEIDYKNTINVVMDNYLGSIMSVNNEDKKYYIIGLIHIRSRDYVFILIKYYFYYDNNGNILYKEEKRIEFDTLDKKIVSCILRNNSIIICIYICRNYKYKIIILNTQLKKEKEKELLIESPESIKVFF